jgi:hypothetical protein
MRIRREERTERNHESQEEDHLKPARREFVEARIETHRVLKSKSEMKEESHKPDPKKEQREKKEQTRIWLASKPRLGASTQILERRVAFCKSDGHRLRAG